MSRHLLFVLVSLLGGAALFASSAAAATKPERLVLNQGKKTLVFYRYRGEQYREVRPEKLAQAQADMRLCFTAKLSGKQGGRLMFHHTALAGMTFSLAPTVKFKAMPGTNVWVGGTLRSRKTVFRIAAAAVMPSDLELFGARWKELQQRPGVAPEAYLRLGWWLARGESLATGLAEAEFRGYREGVIRCYRQALALEEKGLDDHDGKALAARAGRYRQFVKSFGQAAPSGDAGWLFDLYGRFLKAHATAIEELADTKAGDSKERRHLIAGLYRLIGELHLNYFPRDKQTPTRLFLKGIKFNPREARLVKELRARGYVLRQGKWLTPEEIKQHEREKTARARREAFKRRQQELAQARQQVLAKLRRGEGVADIQRQVDPLLSRPTHENLMELAAILEGLSEDVARYALWQAANLPAGVDGAVLLKAGLRSPRPRVRADACDLFAARGQPEDIAVLIKHLKLEKDAPAARHVVDALQGIPAPGGIDALLKLISASGISASVRQRGVKYLQAHTGQKFGQDTFSWKRWWEKNRATFRKRKTE